MIRMLGGFMAQWKESKNLQTPGGPWYDVEFLWHCFQPFRFMNIDSQRVTWISGQFLVRHQIDHDAVADYLDGTYTEVFFQKQVSYSHRASTLRDEPELPLSFPEEAVWFGAKLWPWVSFFSVWVGIVGGLQALLAQDLYGGCSCVELCSWISWLPFETVFQLKSLSMQDLIRPRIWSCRFLYHILIFSPSSQAGSSHHLLS